MNMLKVVATSNNKVLVVLPYNSTGVYGSWELPRSVTDSTKEVLKRAINYEGGLAEIKSFTQAMPNGNVSDIVHAELDSAPGTFHCNIDVKDVEKYPDFPDMIFPAYVQMQLVTPAKACKLLKKSYATIVREALNLPEEKEKEDK